MPEQSLPFVLFDRRNTLLETEICTLVRTKTALDKVNRHGK